MLLTLVSVPAGDKFIRSYPRNASRLPRLLWGTWAIYSFYVRTTREARAHETAWDITLPLFLTRYLENEKNLNF